LFVASKSKKIGVNIIYNPHQKYSVWQGGSMMATNVFFKNLIFIFICFDEKK